MRNITRAVARAAFAAAVATAGELELFRPCTLEALSNSVDVAIAPMPEYAATTSEDGKNIVFAAEFDEAISRAGWYSGHDIAIYDALFQSTMDHEAIGHAYFSLRGVTPRILTSLLIGPRGPPVITRRELSKVRYVADEERALAVQYLLALRREGPAWRYVRRCIKDASAAYIDWLDKRCGISPVLAFVPNLDEYYER